MNDLTSPTPLAFSAASFATRARSSSNMDHKLRQVLDGGARASRPGIVARFAACSVISRVTNQPIDGVAKQHFPGDRDLAALITMKTASPPAMTTVPAWGGEYVADHRRRYCDHLLPTVRSRNCARSACPMRSFKALSFRTPMHTPAPSGAFIGENLAIPVAALILSWSR